MRGLWWILVGLAVLLPHNAWGQGFLLDERSAPYRLPRSRILPHPHPHPQLQHERASYRIKSVEMQVQLQNQIARTQVTQTFVNDGSRPLKACFVFPLPHDGAVDQMTFMVDGKEYEAKLLKAEEARRIFEEHIRRNRDPALVEWLGYGLFKTSVFPLPPGAERRVSLKYSQLCRQERGLTELLLPLSAARYTARPPESVRLNVVLKADEGIKNIYSPSHAVKIERPESNLARVEWSIENQVPVEDFRLLYGVGDGPLAARMLSYKPQQDEDGYFLLLVSPEVRAPAQQKPLAKNCIFVVDRSGSMSGKKIEQAKGALRFVLNNLNEGDLFNIIAYDSEVESFQPELQKYNDQTRRAALGYVEGLFAGGSTNIDGALARAFEQLQEGSRPNYVVFLTDGLPTAGERSEAKIVQNADQRSAEGVRLFSLGVGYDVNSRLLDKLSRTCRGQSIYVRPNEDIEEHVSRLYQRIGSPVLTDLEIQFDMEGFGEERGAPVNRLYPRDVHDLFAGEQLVQVGRYRAGGAARVRLRGKVGSEHHTFEFPVQFVEHSPDESQAYVEKLWALRRVGEIIDQIDLEGKNSELVDELVALATRHGIVTPYTSFLADETSDIRDLAEARIQAGAALRGLEAESGAAGFVQRQYKKSLQQATQSAPVADRLSLAEEAGGTAQNVMHIGRKTFLFRDGQWVDSELTQLPESQVQRIERFTPEYFALISRLDKEEARYLSLDGKVTVVLDGQAYSYEE